MSWLPFSQNQCYCSSKTFAKCVELLVLICCQKLFVFGLISMTFNKKAFVARNCIAILEKLVVVQKLKMAEVAY